VPLALPVPCWQLLTWPFSTAYAKNVPRMCDGFSPLVPRLFHVCSTSNIVEHVRSKCDAIAIETADFRTSRIVARHSCDACESCYLTERARLACESWSFSTWTLHAVSPGTGRASGALVGDPSAQTLHATLKSQHSSLQSIFELSKNGHARDRLGATGFASANLPATALRPTAIRSSRAQLLPLRYLAQLRTHYTEVPGQIKYF